MKTSRAAKLGKQYKRFQNAMIILIPSYIVGRTLVSLIFNV